jgi:hypothetical protein
MASGSRRAEGANKKIESLRTHEAHKTATAAPLGVLGQPRSSPGGAVSVTCPVCSGS